MDLVVKARKKQQSLCSLSIFIDGPLVTVIRMHLSALRVIFCSEGKKYAFLPYLNPSVGVFADLYLLAHK